LLHPSIFDDTPIPAFKDLEKRLAKTFPARQLSPRLKRLNPDALVRFIIAEPFHTEAIRAAWQWLCQKVLQNPQSFPVNSQTLMQTIRHNDRRIAERINTRLKTLDQLCRMDITDLPAALISRLDLARIYADPWATTEIKAMVLDQIDTLARESDPWLTAQTPLQPIDLADAPVVIILDGVSPDVWLDASERLTEFMEKRNTRWFRLEAAPETASAVAALFGFVDDALNEFASRQIPYHQLAGDETEAMVDRLPDFAPDYPVIIRAGMVDTGAHTGRLRLEEMPGVVTEFLKRELPWLQKICREKNRRLVITTDHGLSFTAKGLTHGRGGVFETTIFRMTFK
jgi:hypothetical protein